MEHFMEDLLLFKKPLNRNLQKKYTENFAYRVLKHCFPKQYKDLVQNDVPDLQMPDYSIGIEVTLAVSREVAQIEGEFIKYRIGKQDDNSKIKCCKKIEECGGTVDSISIDYPTISIKDEQKIFFSTIQNKMKKLLSYREKGFKKIGLFMLYQEPPIPPLSIEKDWLACFDLAQKEYSEHYDFLHFCYRDALLTYDFFTKAYKVDLIDYNEFSKKARMHNEF